jgi:hypothetical protein
LSVTQAGSLRRLHKRPGKLPHHLAIRQITGTIWPCYGRVTTGGPPKSGMPPWQVDEEVHRAGAGNHWVPLTKGIGTRAAVRRWGPKRLDSLTRPERQIVPAVVEAAEAAA